jgi:hypothetical protein
VEDLLVMEVKKGQNKLHQPVQDLAFRERLPLPIFDFSVHVTSVTVKHNQVQILLSVDERVLVGNDVGMPDLL